MLKGYLMRKKKKRYNNDITYSVRQSGANNGGSQEIYISPDAEFQTTEQIHEIKLENGCVLLVPERFLDIAKKDFEIIT